MPGLPNACRERPARSASRSHRRARRRRLERFAASTPPSQWVASGGTGIRTLEGLAPLAVFKTAAFGRSAIPPEAECIHPDHPKRTPLRHHLDHLVAPPIGEPDGGVARPGRDEAREQVMGRRDVEQRDLTGERDATDGAALEEGEP